MASEVGRKPDWMGRAFGLVTFFGGIALLVVVFFWTNTLSVPPQTAKKWDAQAIEFGVEVLKRLVCGLIASWIAASGARLYAAANRALSGD